MEKNSGNNNKVVPQVSSKRATSYDVARLAGVSQSAVSRCFKTGASVSAKTRAKVRKAADELGYQPNAIARGLITRRSNIVAVVITEFTTLNYPEMTSRLNEHLAKHDIHILLFTVGPQSDMTVVLDQIWQYQVDGIIASAPFSEAEIQQCAKRGIPLVFYNRIYNDSAVSTVGCDHAEGVKILIDRLVRDGAKRFVVLSGPNDSAVARERLRGATEQIELHRLSVSVLGGDYTYESGVKLTQQVIDGSSLPDAFVCANDVMAIACIDTLRGADLAVPEDVKVVGFDGITVGQWHAYQLTTIEQPLDRMIEATVSMLLERIEDITLPAEKRLFAGKYIDGASA